MTAEPETWEEWVDSRPPAVRDMAIRFPATTQIIVEGVTHWVIGYAEYENDTVGLLVTPFDPQECYDEALAAKITLCPECIPTLIPVL